MEKIQSLPNTKSYDMFFNMKGHWDAICHWRRDGWVHRRGPFGQGKMASKD
jgi:hypothetical protein